MISFCNYTFRKNICVRGRIPFEIMFRSLTQQPILSPENIVIIWYGVALLLFIKGKIEPELWIAAIVLYLFSPATGHDDVDIQTLSGHFSGLPDDRGISSSALAEAWIYSSGIDSVLDGIISTFCIEQVDLTEWRIFWGVYYHGISINGRAIAKKMLILK